jgi:hypothetical protein
MAVDLIVEVGRGFEFESSKLGGRGSGVVLKERGTGLDGLIGWTGLKRGNVSGDVDFSPRSVSLNY